MGICSPEGAEQGAHLAPTALGVGDHVCLVYDDPAEHREVVAPFVREGLARGERVGYVAEAATVGAALAVLEAAGVDVALERARGALVVLTEHDYPPPGPFDPEVLAAYLDHLVDQALADGFGALRLVVEMTWTLERAISREQLLAWEARANKLFDTRPTLAICAYQRRRFPPVLLRTALRTHPLVLFQGQLGRNPYYEPPELLLDQAATETEWVDWMLHHLVRARAAETERERRLREEAARAAAEARAAVEAQLAAIVASSAEAIIGTTLEGNVTNWNPAAERLYGYTAEEMLGRSISVLVPPDRIDEMTSIRARVRRGELIAPYETERVRKDGVRVPVSVSLSPVRDADGRVIGSASIARDITERLRAEAEREQLLEAEQEGRRRQAFLADASKQLADSLDHEATLERVARLAVPVLADWCVVDLLDEDGAIRLVAVAHADPGEEARVLALRAGFPPDPAAAHGLARVLRTGESVMYTQIRPEWRRAAARDAEHLKLMEALDARSSLCVPLIARGRTLGALTFVTSGSGRQYTVEDLELAEDLARRCALALDNARLHGQVQEALRLRDVFLTSMAHDLKTPLAVVKGQAELLRRMAARLRSPETETALAERAQSIAASATRMAAMLDELEDLARLEAGRPLPLDLRPVDLAALVQCVAEEHQGRAARHRIRVETRVPTLVGRWDEGRLRRVLDNLLSNAVKYSPEGGEVAVTLWQEAGVNSDAAVLTVRDHGVGIPAKDLPRLFERFYRAGNVRDRIRGTGLGLWGARGIAEQHRGSLSLSSREGEGTTATLRLPLTAAPGEEAPDAASPQGQTGTGGPSTGC